MIYTILATLTSCFRYHIISLPKEDAKAMKRNIVIAMCAISLIAASMVAWRLYGGLVSLPGGNQVSPCVGTVAAAVYQDAP